MRSFPLYDLHWQEFENLVILLCERILGTGIINFSSGADGGRDGKFNGNAENFPSKTNTWKGSFIIQAKHTTKPTAKCSDVDFKSILDKEVNDRLRALAEKNQPDYYLLFTNRKLSGLAEAQISDFIDSNLGIENCIIGAERIQLWLQEYPDIVKSLNLNALLLPLQFYEKDLKDVILAFSEIKVQLTDIIGTNISKLKWLDKGRKNELNRLSEEYFGFMKKLSLSYFDRIESFLKDPANKKYCNFYENTAMDLQAKILVKRKEYHEFQIILELLFDFVFENSPDLKDRRKLIRVFLHYMYFNCDIGINE